MYFLLAESRDDKENDPLIIWLQGGPGCSGMIGAWTEHGPYNFQYNPDSIKHRGNFTFNPHSWNKRAHVLYIDQPIGTGFSTANNVFSHRVNGEQVSRDFYEFLRNFYFAYPEFKNRRMYLAGESYAGHYIPSISNYLYHNAEFYTYWPAGIIIASGWVDPFYQYPSYPDYAYENSLVTRGHTIVVKIFYELCQYNLIFRIPFLSTFLCQLAGVSLATPGYPAFNVYDIREPCVEFGTCYPNNHLNEVMNSHEYR